MENALSDKSDEMDDDFVIVNLEEDPLSESIKQVDMAASESDGEESFDMFSCEYDSVAPQSSDPGLKYVAKFRNHTKLKEDIRIEDVVKEHVLAFLPAKSLYKCRAVSKEWDKWITNPFFVHQHSMKNKEVSGLFCQLPGGTPTFISLDSAAFGVSSTTLSFLPEPVDIRATCNGLLCCQGHSENQPYYICNPVTKEWRMLPEPKLYHAPGTGVALALEPSTFNFAANYELICVVRLSDLPVLYFEIYSSRTNSWRISGTLCCESDAVRLNGDGFYMKGYAYWQTQSGVVLAFNVNYEEYGILSLPPCSGPAGALTELHGDLCYLLPREHTIEVYGNMKMSLKHVIPISPQAVQGLDGSLRAVCFISDDMLLLELGGKIVAYHVRAQKAEWLSNARDEGYMKYLPYVNNLVTVANPVAGEMD